MSLVLADRVRETTTSTGTGTITLGGAVTGFQSFAVIGNNNTTYYTIAGGTQWEVGLGTYYGGTLSRDTILASSTGSAVNLSAGSKDVFVCYPAEKSVNEDANNRVLIPYTTGTTNVGSLNVGNATAHTDSGVIAGFTASEPLYLYTSLQNTSTANTSYASYAVNDGLHTAYAELGINNSTYSYSAAGYPNNGFSTPLASFVESYGGPLVIGSWDNQKISMIINGAVSTTDAMTINTNGSVAFNGQVGTAGQVLQSNATSAPTWVTPNAGTVTSVSGTTGRITSTGGATPVIDLTSGVATPGTTGSSSLIPVITIDTYGRVTSITTAAAPQGTVTSVSGTSPVASSGGATPAISLSAAYGDTLNPYASKTAKYVLAAPNGADGVPTFRALVASDVPALSYVTSVGGTGTVNGITLTGTVTSSGNLTLGGTLSGIGNTQLTNSTISGVALGGSLFNLTAGTGVSFSSGTTYNGSAGITITATGAGGTVTSVTGTSPVASSGGTTPAISLSSGYGDTLNPFASKTAKYVLAAPNGADGVPTFRAIVASDIPTLNQNTTGSAGTLTTARAIYGNNFDGSAALTQIIASTYGGTGNGFAKLSGPTTAEKTFTLPDASATILTDNAAVTVLQGGTGSTTASGARTNLSAAASGANSDITSVALTTGTISTAPSVATSIVNKTYADGLAAKWG